MRSKTASISPGDAHVERHEDRRFQLSRQRLDIFLRLFVQIGDRQIGAECAERPGAAPGNRLIVGNANDESLLAFEQLGCADGIMQDSCCSGVTKLISGTWSGMTSSALWSPRFGRRKLQDRLTRL